jgi:acid phosphatase family membrane protein YuiD
MRELLLYNPWFTAAAIAWLIAQALKMIFHTIATRRVDFSRLVDSGGMPSSHTAFVTGLCTAIGLTEGWRSPMFAVACCFALIIIYDATNLRRSAGYHAQLLNEVIPQLLHGRIIKQTFTYRTLRELLGHNPKEVLVGILLGVVVALWFIRTFIPSPIG